MDKEMKKFLTIATLSLAMCGSALSLTAGELHEKCKNVDAPSFTSYGDANQEGFCNGYVNGWAETYEDQTVVSPIILSNGSKISVEFVDNVTALQLIHIFNLYVVEHPKEENDEAFFVLWNATHELMHSVAVPAGK